MMRFSKIARRRFLRALLYGTPLATFADAVWLEPSWLKVTKLKIGSGKPSHRLVHFTDLHYKGDSAFLQRVVEKINAVSPDFVCMTGDIIEDQVYLSPALSILKQIKSPMYGVPGNHDYWSHANFTEIAEVFSATGGEWLVDRRVETKDGKVTIHGAGPVPPEKLSLNANTKNLMMMHYPGWIEKLAPSIFDLVLAGHTHGGQVRLPFYGALILPFSTGSYDLGLFKTPSGPLYVSSGIGYFHLNLRFLCRPEIVVLDF